MPGSLLQCSILLNVWPPSAADNVGDNVGDIAGMGADLFGSFAESTCAALVISSVSTLGRDHYYVAMSYPLMISAAGILVCFFTTFVATDLRPARIVSEIENTLKFQLVISTVIATPVRPCALLVAYQAPFQHKSTTIMDYRASHKRLSG